MVLMQTSGFATLANVMASLPCAYQIPVLLMVSERGTLGEFNIGQAAVWRTMRPTLEPWRWSTTVITRLDECEFTVDRTIRQAHLTQQPAALILSPLLTGGKAVTSRVVAQRWLILTAAHNAKRMYRFDLMQRLVARLHHQEAVVGGIGHTNFDLWSAGHRPQNFYMLGSMGLAIPIALGVALAQPHRKVFALEGDGSLLMQLGCLATVASLAPKNLTILVMDNGMYQITGGQGTPAAGGADYAAIARGCGLANAGWAADEGDFERLVNNASSMTGRISSASSSMTSHR